MGWRHAVRRSGTIPCINPPMCSSSAPCANSRDGARSPNRNDRGLRPGGGERRSSCSAYGRRCRLTGARVWNCRMARHSPMARRFCSPRSPIRPRYHGPAISRAMRGIPIRPDRQRRAAAFFRLDRGPAFSGAASVAGCSGGDTITGAGRSSSANCCGGTGLLNRYPCISSQA
jgi:hypothetical protein